MQENKLAQSYTLDEEFLLDKLVQRKRDGSLVIDNSTQGGFDFSRILKKLFGPNEKTSTFPVFTEKDDAYDLSLKLVGNGDFPSDYARFIWDGKFHIQSFDQLILSSQPTRVVHQLANRNFGTWPVPKGLSLQNIDTDRLRLDLDREQRGLIRLSEQSPENLSVYWFNEHELFAKERLMPQKYYPTLNEMLWLFNLYSEKTGKLPDTKGNWIFTRSSISLPLQKSYEETIDQYDPKKILFDACINIADERDAILKYLAIPGDFSQKIAPYKKAERTGDDFTITNDGKKVYHQIGDHFLHAKIGTYQYIDFSRTPEGVEVLTKTNDGIVQASYAYSTLARQISMAQSKAHIFFSQDIEIPFVVTSDPKKGVKVGVTISSLKSVLDWQFADGLLKVNYGDVLRPSLEHRFAYLPMVEKASWPKIINDNYVHNLTK